MGAEKALYNYSALKGLEEQTFYERMRYQE
jgi:hypothetical protein